MHFELNKQQLGWKSINQCVFRFQSLRLSLPILHFSSAYDFPLVPFLILSPNEGRSQ
jgi:hypothetical protein